MRWPVVHPDRRRWNDRYGTVEPSFQPHALLLLLSRLELPEGPVLELASGASGTALALAARGRRVVAVDISDVGLAQLGREARGRDLTANVAPLVADLESFEPPLAHFAIVIATRYWSPTVFTRGCGAVAPGGILAWEAFTRHHQRHAPSFPEAYCLGDSEPVVPPSFATLVRRDMDDGRTATRWLVARRSDDLRVGGIGEEPGRGPQDAER